MRCLRIGALLALALGAAWTDARAQERLLGERVRVTQSGTLARLRGELIAVSLDSLWLLRDSTLLAVPSSQVISVEVKRRPMGVGGIMLWGLVGGAVSGAALTGACVSYGDRCGAVLPAVMLTWTLWSGIWAAVAGSAYQRFPVEQIQTGLPPFARFPQGLPAEFNPGRPRPLPPDTSVGSRTR